MSDFMTWLYYFYIMPTLETTCQREYEEPLTRLRAVLSVPLEMDLERVMECYASAAFRLGLRTGAALDNLLSEEG